MKNISRAGGCYKMLCGGGGLSGYDTLKVDAVVTNAPATHQQAFHAGCGRLSPKRPAEEMILWQTVHIAYTTI